MIIIPSRKTVLLLVPRTGSGSLKLAVLERYPDAFMLYRHMEADGVPAGYDRWKRVGVLRHPLDRLWSLYQFCNRPTIHAGSYARFPELWERLQRSVSMPFEEWLLNNETVFTQAHDSAGRGRFWPEFNTLHALPENRKSQFVYLRPDLGTSIYTFEELDSVADLLDVELGRKNSTDVAAPKMSDLSKECRQHIESCFAWDLAEWSRRRAKALA